MRALIQHVYRQVGAVARRIIGRKPLSSHVLAAAGTTVAAMAVAVSLTVGGAPAHGSQEGSGAQVGIGVPTGEQDAINVPAGRTVATATKFSGIVLPDVLVVVPSGLTTGEIAALRAIKGVRRMITFDGAQITAGGRPASVIGVDPTQFRSWVPLSAAENQPLWADLAAGEFLASTQAASRLSLTKGASYQLTGASAHAVTFAGSASLAVTGIDLVVNQSVSKQLGLVHQVAALISAPGPTITSLTSRVRRVLGSAAKVVALRGPNLPLSATQPRQITNYLTLFQASAAKYCPTMSWTVLAAIGQIESADGQNMGPSSAGALGPMQFLPSTWAVWGIDGFGPAGPPNVMNPLDAVPSAARMLCADGASAGTEAGLRQAIFDYNHATWYVNEVLALAQQYAAGYH